MKYKTMKNIHLLPTGKPSRFSLNSSGKYHLTNQLHTNSPNFTNQHIYITSNEEIKVGDWVIEFQKNDNIEEVHFINGEYVIERDIQKKIILTTDQDLINDGVQAIDDKFLEWFVKNPSCEEVEVNSIETNPDYKSNWENRFTYEIIIPKEEPKPHSFCETLEEAMNQNGYHESDYDKIWREGVEFGAKWQAGRMYSEEEVYHILCEHTAFLFAGGKSTLTDWFERFKKK